MFVSYFLKLFLITLFENTDNTILVLSKNLSCYLNIMFSVFFMSFITKRNWEPNIFFMFSLFS